MPLFADGQDPLDAQGAAQRSPLGAPEPDPFARQPDFNDTLGAAFRQNNPIVSVIEAVGAQSPNHQVDPSYNPMSVIKGTPFEQNPRAFIDDPNESVTRARMTQMQQEENDRQTLAQSGTAGVVAALGAGLLDPSFYIPIVGEAHSLQGEASFVRTAGRMAALGGGQAAISEGALQASQQSRSWKEGVGNIATNTLLMGLLGGALGRLAAPERLEASEALEAVRRDATPVNPLDPSSMSLHDHTTPGESGFSRGVEQRAAELHAAGAANTPIEAAEAAHIEGLPQEIAHEVDGGAAQEGIGAAAERGGAGGEYDPQGALGEQGSGLRPDRGSSDVSDASETPPYLASTRRGQVFYPGGSVDVRYGLAEHGDLVTSHDDNFQTNPLYPPELQPRDRSSVPAQDQVNTIAANLEPERLGPSPEANAGAPIVGPDGVVESGNGRTIGIGQAYDSGRGEGYRAWLERQGFDTTGFDKPVLVGMRETPLDDAGRAAFAHAANGSASLRMSATEQALSDARHLDSGTVDLAKTSDLSAAANRDFARAFVAKLPQGERGGMLTRDGGLSANGVRRAQAAMAARAYGDPAFLSRALDHPDPNIKAIAGALSDAAGPWARMRDAATRGDIEPGHDITRDMLQAVHAIMRARDEGRPAWEMLNQGDIFQSDTTQLAARMFFRDEAMRQPAGRARVAEALRSYAEEAGKNTTSGRLFDDAISPTDVLRRAATVAVEKLGGLLDTGAQDAMAMARHVEEPAARARAETESEPAAETQQDLTLRNPTTGAEAQAQAVSSFKDALKQFDVSRNDRVDVLTRASSMAIGDRLGRLVGDMRVFTVGPAEMRALAEGRIKMQAGFEPAGFFDPKTGHIAVLDDAMRDPREAAPLLIHEGLHGAFMQTINESEAARNVIDHLRTLAASVHFERGGEAADHYGLTNAHEFVSEGLSNPEFQRFLASVPADDRIVQAFGLDKAPGYSLWDVFVGAVRKILGLAPDQHTLLDASMRLGDLLEQRRAELLASAEQTGEIDHTVRPSLRPQEAGADVVDRRDFNLKGFGIDKVPGLGDFNAKLSPNLRIYSGSSTQAKRAAADLANTSLRFTMHDRGIPTSEGGSLESAVQVDKSRFMVAAHEALEQAYVDHRYGGTAPSTARRGLDSIADLRGQTPDGKLGYKQFKEAVYDAAYSGDQHPIPEVQKAAQDFRANVLDPVKKMAQETLGPDGRPMLSEELSPPKGDKSFVPRMWNHEAIKAKRYQLKKIISDWYEGEQRTKAASKERIEDFVGDLEASTKKLATMAEDDPARAAEQATHDAIRQKIEKEIADWQGSSTAEAKSALDARAKAEERRQAKMDEGTYRGAGERLTSADSSVDAATRKILASDRDLSRGELEDRADETIDRIIGSPDGRIPYDAASGGPKIGYSGGPKPEVRGSLKSRDFAIPTELVKDFVQRDLEHVSSSFLRTMLPDIYLTRRFGDVDMTDTFRRIQEEYARKIGPGTSEAASRKLHAQRDSDIADVATLRDRLRGVHGWNPDPAARKVASIIRDFHNFTSLGALGTSVANRLNDIGAQAVMRNGLQNVFNDAWRPFFKSMLGMSPLAGIAKQQAKEMGVGIDGLLGHLRHNLSDINDNYLPGSKFSRGLAWANDRSMLINLHGPWTDWMKAMSWVPAQAELGRVADRIAAGSQKASDLARMADAGISPSMAARISQQMAEHSITVDGVRLATADKWTDLGARDAFERAMVREANINVISAGIGQKPTFLTKPLGGLIGQFKGFVAGAHENILLSNLQQRDGRTMQGALVAMSMGMLSYRLYTLLAGQEASPRPQDWIKEGIARSALTGWFNEANNTLAKFTAGKVDYNRLYGADRPLTRRTENSPLSELLGPTYARLEGLTGIGVHVLGGHATAADIHQGRQMIPLQNLMGFRILGDNAEDGVANALGLKPRNHSPHEWPQ